MKLKALKRSDPEQPIDFVAKDMPMINLADWFEWLFPGQILLPASRMRETFSTGGVLRQIKLGDLMERIGLVGTSATLVGRDLPDEPDDAPSTGCCGSSG